MLTILHAADLHLDSPFRSLPAREAQARRQGQRESLERLRDLALEHRADLVLLPGDLFDSQQVYPETLEALSRVLGELPCPVCIAPGNHDYFSDKSPYAQPIWPENVHIFSSETVAAFAFPDLGVTVHGCAFTSPFRETDPLAGFTAPQDGLLHIGCFHGEVGKQSRYAPIAPESLAQSGLRYAALGHVHAAETHDGPVAWAYPGCTQGRGFDEVGQKGCYLVRLDGAQAAFSFCPLPGPRYWALRQDVTGQEPAAALSALLAEYDREDYLRVTLTGQASGLDLPALRAFLEPMCRVLELRDETLPPQDIWARREEDTLTGHFLREMAGRLEAAPEEERPALQMALRYGLAALEGREQPR